MRNNDFFFKYKIVLLKYNTQCLSIIIGGVRIIDVVYIVPIHVKPLLKPISSYLS